jgi:methylphosphotriester-DNA--protein-cysteine methyltransferase
MAYDLMAIADIVLAQLEAMPLMSSKAIAETLGVARHTVQRAVRVRHDMSFRQLQAAVLRDHFARSLEASATKSVKEISAALGYEHSRSLSRRSRQLLGLTPTQFRRCRQQR